MSSTTESVSPIETLRAQIKDVRMAMLSTTSRGHIVSRPMSSQAMGPDGTLWFLTSAGSNKVKEIAVNPSVGIAFVDAGAETYVSIAGLAQITNDRAKIAEFWNPFFNAWFDGPNDPTIQRSVSLP